MIGKYLDLSTGHVSKDTADFIQWQCIAKSAEGIIAYKKGQDGWIVHVSDELDVNVPQDLVKVIDYARSQGCYWIMFDCDGDFIDELEQFNW